MTDHKHASHAPASEPEPEMTHLYLAELNSRGREVAPCLNGSSMMFYQVGMGVGMAASLMHNSATLQLCLTNGYLVCLHASK